ncbi:MAG: phospholipase [Acidobacteria bacterium]|nr:phospholipase [Acidobacteriota bacterium]
MNWLDRLAAYYAVMPRQPEPTAHTINASTLGRYLVSPPAQGDAAPLLVGFHGYGENAELHLQALRGIPGVDQWRVASVQALHRFYQTRTGDVVASWMTKQDREQAIRDNVTYVRNVVTALRSSGAPDTPLVYCGFSQGVAMAYRAALGAGHRCNGLIVLAGDVPPELRDAPADRWPPILLGCGRSDEWHTEAKLQADRDFLESRDIEHNTVVFDGGHEWHADFHEAAGRFLERVRADAPVSGTPA